MFRVARPRNLSPTPIQRTGGGGGGASLAAAAAVGPEGGGGEAETRLQKVP